MKKFPLIVAMAALASTPVMAEWDAEVSLSDAGEFYVTSGDAINADNDELVEIMVSMDPESTCEQTLTVFVLEDEPKRKTGSVELKGPKFRIDKGDIHEFERATMDLDNATDDDGTVYGRGFAYFELDDDMASEITQGTKIIYTHEGQKTYRWSLENSAVAISNLAKQCRMYAEDEWGTQYGKDSPSTESTSDNSEWSL